MEYSELKKIAESQKIELKGLAEEIEMTAYGFRRAVENETLTVSKLRKLCNLLGISPNDYFGNSGDVVNQSIIGGVSGTVTGIDRRQYYSDSPDVLKAQVELLEERIKEKDSQIKEKDSQINSLLSILKGK